MSERYTTVIFRIETPGTPSDVSVVYNRALEKTMELNETNVAQVAADVYVTGHPIALQAAEAGVIMATVHADGKVDINWAVVRAMAARAVNPGTLECRMAKLLMHAYETGYKAGYAKGEHVGIHGA